MSFNDYHQIAINHIARHSGEIEIDANPYDTPPEVYDLQKEGLVALNMANSTWEITEQGKAYLNEHPEHPMYDDPLAPGHPIIPEVKGATA